MIMTLLKFIFFLIVLLGAFSIPIFFTPLGEVPLTTILSVGDVKPTNFQTLKFNPNPNQYLICPENTCIEEKHDESPVFNVPVDRLQSTWKAMLAEQPNIEILRTSADSNSQDLVQRTRLVRYPDIVSVEFSKISETQSTLSVYSRSIYGRSDFGANKTRIDAWISRLKVLASR
ncbi:MAG: DUF1499 domain-containing protein [Sneathiella sp.]